MSQNTMNLDEFTARYKYDPIKDKIGSGGFGDVFKAYDTILNETVALKISKVENKNIRLSKEAKMASALPLHINIARYEDCYSFITPTGEYDFGILQYYEHGNLNQLLNSQSLSYETISAILRQVLNGLEFLHSQKIIHRDMKPKNILMVITPDGEYVPKITDFGISKKLDTDKSHDFSHSLTGVGSLSFISPEQLKADKIRRNTDLWSLGVTAYQAFTGQLPFTSGDEDSASEAGQIELFRQIAAGEVPDGINKIIEPWRSLILKCLVPDPAIRIQSAKECLEFLDNWKPEPPPPPESDPPVGSGSSYRDETMIDDPPPPDDNGGKTTWDPGATRPSKNLLVYCHNCGEEILLASRFCRHCGATQKETTGSSESNESGKSTDDKPNSSAGTWPCPHCSDEIAVGVTFCRHCGRDVDAVAQ
ncbi:MAG: serine/threonine-protein kinase [Holophagaceae bacterium]|nr:serine/threonine-protein kinase [Holophagaceae bacterium]